MPSTSSSRRASASLPSPTWTRTRRPSPPCWPRRSAPRPRGRPPRPPSGPVVFVVVAPPDARVVATPGRAVEPLVHAPEAVHSPRIGGVGVVDDAVLEHESAHARPFPDVRGHVGSGHGRHPADVPLVTPLRTLGRPRRLALVVVFDAPRPLLLRGEPDAELGVEVGAERGRPGKRPA